MTFKDFQALGASASFANNGNRFAASVWSQDYDEVGDIFILGYFSEKFHFGVNNILWLFEQGSKYRAIYLLPYSTFSYAGVRIFGEVGVKLDALDDRSGENSGVAPDESYAGLVGCRWDFSSQGWQIKIGPELRADGKNFIPLTNVAADVYTSMDNYGRSTNNWVDFFSAVENNYWAHLFSSIQTPRWHDLSIFFDNHLLLFASKQSMFWDRQSSALISYNPSSEYYWAGIRYHFSNAVKMEALITNNLVNLDPKVNQEPWKDITALQYSEAPMRQYNSRYYPSDFPIIEFRLAGYLRRGPQNPG